MNPTQSAIVSARAPAVGVALQAAASAALITVAELVEAGIGRGGRNGTVMMAADRFNRAHPGLLASFRDSWPFECAYCKRDDLRARERCPICTLTLGCDTCVTPLGCPPCRAAAALAQARARAANVERQRSLEAIARIRNGADDTPEHVYLERSELDAAIVAPPQPPPLPPELVMPADPVDVTTIHGMAPQGQFLPVVPQPEQLEEPAPTTPRSPTNATPPVQE